MESQLGNEKDLLHNILSGQGLVISGFYCDA